MVLAGLVLVGGAVVALRLAGGTPGVDATPPPAPLPTVIKPYSAQGVLAPRPGAPPAAPSRLIVTPGPRRLQVTWAAAADAAGYDVHWGGTPGNDRLVAEPDAELDGLTPGQDVTVQVQSVDSFGQRSPAATTVGRAQPDGAAGADNAFTDHFTGTAAPDPRLWRLASTNDCASAGKGPDGRLMVLSECARSTVTLRSRTPLRPRGSGSELGRFTIDTDAPGESGELDIDLVPGQVATIDGSFNDPLLASPPNIAVSDADLPPGTIRVRVGAAVDLSTGVPGDTVQVAAGSGVPTVPPVTEPAQAIPVPRTGLSVRWDVVLRTDGVEVLRDGVRVGGGNVVPSWSEATPLVEFSSDVQTQQRYDVGMIGLGGAATSAPPVGGSPRLIVNTNVAPASTPSTALETGAVAGPGSGTLLMTALVQPFVAGSPVTINGAPPTFVVQVGPGGETFPATPAVPGTPLLPQVRYPLVAQVPASVLNDNAVTIRLFMQAPASYPAAGTLQSADIDVTPGGVPRTAPQGLRISPLGPQLAMLTARVLDASGNPPPPGGVLPRGRAVLDVTIDGVTGQRLNGDLAGLAGFTVWLDDAELVAVPTAVDGPAVGGEWQIAFNAGAGTKGTHSIDIRAYAAKRGVSFAESYTSYVLGP